MEIDTFIYILILAIGYIIEVLAIIFAVGVILMIIYNLLFEN